MASRSKAIISTTARGLRSTAPRRRDQAKRLTGFRCRHPQGALVNGQPLFDPHRRRPCHLPRRREQHGELELRARAQTDGGAMTSYLDRLNLRPFEKRLVVGVGAVLFVVLNAWFVFPHFSDLARPRRRRPRRSRSCRSGRPRCDQMPEIPEDDHRHHRREPGCAAGRPAEPVFKRDPDAAGPERGQHHLLRAGRAPPPTTSS